MKKSLVLASIDSMLNKFEALGIAGSIVAMSLALYFLRLETQPDTELASTLKDQPALVVVSDDGGTGNGLYEAIAEDVDEQGSVQSLIVDDVKQGAGDEVAVGDTVVVHYIGTLQNGQEFDNSNKKGEPFTFTVGKGQVIKGWDQGIVGMREGGQRILVIPASLAYGNKEVGGIPKNSTLVFAVELLEIK